MSQQGQIWVFLHPWDRDCQRWIRREAGLSDHRGVRVVDVRTSQEAEDWGITQVPYCVRVVGGRPVAAVVGDIPAAVIHDLI